VRLLSSTRRYATLTLTLTLSPRPAAATGLVAHAVGARRRARDQQTLESFFDLRVRPIYAAWLPRAPRVVARFASAIRGMGV